MRLLETTKGATAETVNALRSIDQLAGRIDTELSLQVLRAQRLASRFRLSQEHADLVARLYFREVTP